MTEPRLRGLDATKLGEALVTAYLISRQLGHERVLYTLRDYYHPGPDDYEQAFLVDLFTESTDAIAERWFGGVDRELEARAHAIGTRQWPGN